MKTVLKVPEMACSHCENAIHHALDGVNGVSEVVIDLANKTVTIAHSEIADKKTLVQQVEDAGYDVVL